MVLITLKYLANGCANAHTWQTLQNDLSCIYGKIISLIFQLIDACFIEEARDLRIISIVS